MKNHPDTPITALGKKQAQETGIFLSQLLKQYPNAKVILESSPYIRC
jgi:broad specificity phosphatase PhoE